jgi:hypothetical protein
MSTEFEHDDNLTDEELDLEGPNEGAAGDNPELDESLDDLEDDDGYADEDDEDAESY